MSDDDDALAPTDAFTIGIRRCYDLGNRLKRTPLFRGAHIRRYKRLFEREAVRLHHDSNMCNLEDAQPTYVDHSIVGHYPIGTPAYQFYNSWPNKITLVNMDMVHPTSWSVVVQSKHCPFCQPSGRCDTLKDLLDHLESHHQQFSYRAKRNHDDTAVIMLRLRDNQWIEFDVMYRTLNEGYLLSSRLRKRFPHYVPKVSKRGDLDFPFVVNLFTKPRNYRSGTQKGGVHGNHSGNTTSNRPKRTLSKSKSTGTIRNTNRSVGSGNKAAAKTKKRNTTKKNKPHRASTTIGRKDVTDNLSSKRKAVSVPTGMGNSHTVHFRNVMFRQNAHIRSAGEGQPSRLNREAAFARLYNTVSNIPLDVETFNDGFDSDLEDGGAEREWRLVHQDGRIASFVDVLPIEKYYSVLWNSFASQDVRGKSDRGLHSLLIDFVKVHGGEVKRMKLEIVFIIQVALSWHHGKLDVEAVMEILRTFKKCKLTSRQPCADFSLPERLEREQNYCFREIRSYTGLQTYTKTWAHNPTAKEWLKNEEKATERLSRVASMIQKGQNNALSWMAEMPKTIADDSSD